MEKGLQGPGELSGLDCPSGKAAGARAFAPKLFPLTAIWTLEKAGLINTGFCAVLIRDSVFWQDCQYGIDNCSWKRSPKMKLQHSTVLCINLVWHKLKYKCSSDFGMSTQYMYFNPMEEPLEQSDLTEDLQRPWIAATELLLTQPLAKGSFPDAVISPAEPYSADPSLGP